MFHNFLFAVSREASISCLKNTHLMSRMAGTPSYWQLKKLRAAVRKYRLGVCKMKKSKIPKLCQNIGLGKLFLEK